jgi:CHAT domain-containing protein
MPSPSPSAKIYWKICWSLAAYALLLRLCCPLHGQSAQEAVKLSTEAIAFQDQGKYGEALPLLKRALAISEKSFGPEHPDTGASLNNLAYVYCGLGDYGKALPLLKRALVISEKSFGPEHPDTGNSLNSLAAAYRGLGDHGKAMPLDERALAIFEDSLGPEHPTTAISLNNLAFNYIGLGDYGKALPLLKRALAISEKSLSPENGDTGASLLNLAAAYRGLGDYGKALPLDERALAISEKRFGSEHFNTAVCLVNMAHSYRGLGDFAKALPLDERALAIREKHFGPTDLDTANSLDSLATTYSGLGDYAKALQLLERALVIFEGLLGPQHPSAALTLNNLAEVTYKAEDASASRSYASKAIAAKQRELQSILSLDEQARLSWQKANLSYWYACILRPEPLAQLVIRQKGVVLDSLLEDRSLVLSAANDPEGDAKLDDIASLRSQLSKIAFDKNKEREAVEMQEQISQLQRSLTARSNVSGRVRMSADTTIDAIIPALSDSSALIDLIRFDDPKLIGEESTCYGAIITGSDGTPTFVRIDGGTAIDQAITKLRSAINKGQPTEVEEHTKFLSEKLWQPIAVKIPEGTKQLILCPDAKLNFLSFGTLLEDDGSFVAKKYPIVYIGSGRDLARKPSGEVAKSLVVFADPVFDTSGDASSVQDMIAMRSAEADVFGTINLPPLPGTKAEAEQLELIAAGAGWDIEAITGKEATESNVREAKKPGILHLATHGFYLNSFTPPAGDGTRGMSVVALDDAREKKQSENGVDPMRASGVALTGAQQTLKLWSQRKAPDPETDGILTAEEVASLDLNGTWLVTLSACETGVGEARSGEGVFGLRRAFMMAGAENLLMTLWPVADDTTAKIMADFYKEALATGDAPGSLAKVQRDWLVKLREEKGLAAAIREAGPFAMVMMTAPTHPPVELPPTAKAEPASDTSAVSTEQPNGDAPAPEKKSAWWPL